MLLLNIKDMYVGGCKTKSVSASVA